MLAACLLVALALGQWLYAQRPQADTELAAAQLEQAVLDRIGVTRWEEALAWYAWEETSGFQTQPAQADTPVWVALAGGSGDFHSNPLCGAMHAPQRTTLALALAEGRKPCPRCWEIEKTQ